ncbi:MAG: hypothetical protein JNM07_04110 [Phycisphaerae bacterium]|nr:hypothetical protein [Phycisphaerae bacterium]
MNVTLDDRPLGILQPTLAHALEAARRDAGGRGRVIVEALLDGRPLADRQLSAPDSEPRPASELRFTSADPRALVRDGLRDAAEALDRVRDTQRRAAELLQCGRVTEAIRELPEVLSAWEAARTMLADGCSLLSLDVDAIPSSDGAGRPGARASSLGAHLRAATSAVGAQDWARLADLLAYDLDQEAERWRSLLESFARSLAA